MRDRFPLVVAARLILAVGVAWLFGESGKRGTFADPGSTYRSEPDGSRALFLMAQKLGLRVARRHVDFQDLDASKTGALVLLGIERLPSEDAKKLESFVSAGGQLLIVAGKEDKSDGFIAALLHSDQGVLGLFDLKLSECDSPAIERQLEVALPSPLTEGVEAPLARVAGYLSREGGKPLLPLVLDPHADGRAVMAALDHAEGRVIAISAPDLASNRALGRGDNARLWASMLRSLSGAGPVEIDEFHHGFTSERSISGYATRHGLHWALLQTLLALWVWVAARRRFGRAQRDPDEERIAGADYLWAMARIYRQGGHRAHAAQVLLDGLVRSLASRAGVGPKASLQEVAHGLGRHGRPDLSRALVAAGARLPEAQASDQAVLSFARTCASVRKLAERAPPAKSQPTKVDNPESAKRHTRLQSPSTVDCRPSTGPDRPKLHLEPPGDPP